MKYNIGEIVEIIVNDDGIDESYFEAKIDSYSHSREEYFVRYITLLDGDNRYLHAEYIPEENIRPLPLQIVVEDYKIGVYVDAKINEGGWTVGKVQRKLGEMFLIYFEKQNIETVYEISGLRYHQEYDEDEDIFYYSKK